MFLRDLWFSFEGRASRLDFWFGWFFLVPMLGAAAIGFDNWLGLTIDPSFEGGPTTIAWFALYIWSMLAVMSKRLHDIGWSAWWLIVFFPTAIGMLISIFVKGDKGENRFGDDPLQRRSNIPKHIATNVAVVALIVFLGNLETNDLTSSSDSVLQENTVPGQFENASSLKVNKSRLISSCLETLYPSKGLDNLERQVRSSLIGRNRGSSVNDLKNGNLEVIVQRESEVTDATCLMRYVGICEADTNGNLSVKQQLIQQGYFPC